MTFVAPEALRLARGETADLTIEIERKNFDDEATVEFDNVSKGVHIVGATGLNMNAGPVNIDIGHQATPIAGDGAVHTLKADNEHFDGNTTEQRRLPVDILIVLSSDDRQFRRA